MNKAPVTQALEVLQKNLDFMNRHKNGKDFFMGLYDDNHDTLIALQKWVDDVPDMVAKSVECSDGSVSCVDWEVLPHGCHYEATKHLLKGIENDG